MLEENEKVEQEIPVEWRPVIIEIVENIRKRSLKTEKVLGFQCSVDPHDVDLIYYSIDSYDETLVSLPDDTWQTSICRWMGNYWHLLIDLFTVSEGLSDLVLFLNVQKRGDSFVFIVQSVHVP